MGIELEGAYIERKRPPVTGIARGAFSRARTNVHAGSTMQYDAYMLNSQTVVHATEYGTIALTPTTYRVAVSWPCGHTWHANHPREQGEAFRLGRAMLGGPCIARMKPDDSPSRCIVCGGNGIRCCEFGRDH